MVERTRNISAIIFLLAVICSPLAFPAAEEEQGSSQVMQAFTSVEVEEGEAVAIDDQTKREIMFFMGIPLLLLIVATTALGVAMGVYGKPVFLAHMICAGFTVTLAFAHAVVGLVWFYPF